MGMAAILVMWPGPFKQTVVLPSHGGSIRNLIGQAVSEEKHLNCVDDERRRTDNGVCLNYQLNYEPKGSGRLKKSL